MIKILVCGSRDWTNKESIKQVLSLFPRDSIIIHGDNGYDKNGKPLWGESDELAVRGADKLAGQCAKELGFNEIRIYTPDWSQGRKGGMLRNIKMFDSEHPDFVLAFHEDLSHSKGTKQMLRYTEEQKRKLSLGCSIYHFDH